MIEFAKWRFALLFGGVDGKDMLLAIEQLIALGRPVRPEHQPRALVSGEAKYLFERFLDISAGRSSNGWGISPLTWADFDTYCRTRQAKLSNWELDMLRAIDCEYVNAACERDRKQAAATKK